MGIFSRKRAESGIDNKLEDLALNRVHDGYFCGPCRDMLEFFHAPTFRALPQLWIEVINTFDPGLLHQMVVPFYSKPWCTPSCGVCSILLGQELQSYLDILRYGSGEGKPRKLHIWRMKNVWGLRQQVTRQMIVETWPMEYLGYDNSRVHSLSPDAKSHPIVAHNITFNPELRPLKLGRSTGSDATLQTIQHWLYNCERDHKACRKLAIASGAQSWRPLRLLDLRQLHHGRVLLSERTQTAQPTAYSSLSYRWGTKQNFTLTEDDLPKWRQHGIPLKRFPIMMQQAMFTTQKLGTEYLWIDAICLVQTPQSRWQEEAVDMDKVYGCARFNITADASPDPFCPLFRDRDESSAHLAGTIWTGKPLARRQKGVVQLKITTSDPWKTFTERSNTTHRAWIFQEEMLPLRRIHFGEDQIFWYCGHSQICETFPTGRTAVGTHSDILKKEFDGLRLKEPSTGRLLNESMYRKEDNRSFEVAWSYAVTSFTRRDISYPGDRLKAISGVAAEFAKIKPGNKYHAGLWAERMEWFLCWTGTEHGSTRRIHPFQAPTWSWGSVIGPVQMDIVHGEPDQDQAYSLGVTSADYYSYTSLIHIFGADTVLQTSRDQTGGVQSGSLRLAGYLLDVQYTMTNGPHQTVTRMTIGNDSKGSRHSHGEESEYRCYLDDVALIRGDVYFLPILYTTTTPPTTIRGMLLQPTADRGTFQRIGYLSVRIRLSELSRFLSPKTRPRALQHDRFLEQHREENQYTIDVV